MAWTEELGFDSIWLTEHHFIDYGLSVSPAVLATAAAMRTRRVRIGLAAAILPFHDPIRLAEELAMVDILSEGRLDVGVGRGNRPVEFEGYRVPQIENRERFEECLAILLKAWTQDRFSFEGRSLHDPRGRVIPSRSSSRIPGLRRVHEPRHDRGHRAARRAHAQLAAPRRRRSARQEPRHLREGVRRRGGSAAETASLLSRWGVSRHVYVAPTDAQALAEARDAEMWYQESLRRFLIPERIDRVHPLLQPGFRAMQERFATVSWEQLVAESVAFGSPDTVAERVDEFRRLGVGEMLCWMNFGGLPQDQVRRSMELFAREVMPRFR
mgnify:CR=1 FL=1